MLGWEVIVYRRADDLVKANKAVDLGGNGYPNRYSVAAGVLRSVLSHCPSPNTSPLIIGEDCALHPGWSGLKLDKAKLGDCPSEEQLLLEAWDQS